MPIARRFRIPAALPSLALAALVAVGLAGCEHIQRYPEPAAGKVARLRIVSDGRVSLAPGATCEEDFEGPRAGRAQLAREQAYLFGEEGKATGPVEVAVPAGEPLFLRYEHKVVEFERSDVCTIDWVFTPEEGRRYEAVGEAVGTRERKCRLTVRAVGDAAGPLATPAPVENRFSPKACSR